MVFQDTINDVDYFYRAFTYIGRKIAMPYEYPPHVANSSWLSNQGRTWAHFKNHLYRQSQ